MSAGGGSARGGGDAGAAFDAALRDAGSLLFLCSGNMIRSPFAQLYAAHLGSPLPARSAATIYHNDGLHPRSAEALRRLGVGEAELRGFRCTYLGDVSRALPTDALVLGMTRDHLASVALHPALRRRAFLLERALGRDTEIADPLLSDRWDEAFERIARAVEALVERLRDGR